MSAEGLGESIQRFIQQGLAGGVGQSHVPRAAEGRAGYQRNQCFVEQEFTKRDVVTEIGASRENL